MTLLVFTTTTVNGLWSRGTRRNSGLVYGDSWKMSWAIEAWYDWDILDIHVISGKRCRLLRYCTRYRHSKFRVTITLTEKFLELDIPSSCVDGIDERIRDEPHYYQARLGIPQWPFDHFRWPSSRLLIWSRPRRKKATRRSSSSRSSSCRDHLSPASWE